MRDDTYRTDFCFMDPIQIGKYGLEFYTREQYWSGSGTQDYPGTFMDNCMYLTSCERPTPKEMEALRSRKAVLHLRREITDQPEGYSEFMHNVILKNPEKYLGQIGNGIYHDNDSCCKPPSYKEIIKDFKKCQKKLENKK